MFNPTHHRSWRVALTIVVASMLGYATRPASAVYEKDNGTFPWSMQYHGHHEQPIIDKLGKGFFMNVGPTGLRAQITHEHPAYFTIRFVFEDSPAAGKIEAGDVVIGANGKVMNVPHTFGRRHDTGMHGPMTLMAQLIEDSQGRDGKLDLIVWPGGDKAKQKVVTLQLEPVGRFAATYPYNCERTDKLVRRLCDFLVGEYERDGSFKTRVHTHSACVLALMASGDDRYAPLIRKIMADYRGNRYDPNNGGGFPTWGWGYDGIVMGEYYLLTRDKSLEPAMASLAEAYELGQDWVNGGYSHKPFPAIQQRIAAGGPKGYGAMSQPGGMAMIAQSLFKEAGLPYSQECYERLHQAYLAGKENGYVDYGFPIWDHAVIELERPDSSPCKSKRGIGYLCETGMKQIGPYKVLWPGPDENRSWVNKDTSWLVKEASTNRVYQAGGDKRLVVRSQPRSEPKGPLRVTGEPIGHYGRSGQGALAHLIGDQPQSWKWLGERHANACASSPGDLMRGHASTLMGTLWGSLGAARADERRARQYFDEIKWWFIMAETHNGGFVVMPGHDYASTDNYYGTRNLPTATAALILSTAYRKLRITGYEPGASSRSVADRPTPRSTTPARSTTPQPSTPQPSTPQPAETRVTNIARQPAATPGGNRSELVKQVLEARRRLADIKATVLEESEDVEYQRARALYENLRARSMKPGAGEFDRQAALDAGSRVNKLAEHILAADPRVADAEAEVIEAMKAFNESKR